MLLYFKSIILTIGFSIICSTILYSQIAKNSTLLCLEEQVKIDKTIVDRQRDMERYIQSKGISFIDLQLPISIQLILHDHREQTSESLRSSISSQLSKLNQAFQVDTVLFKQITGNPIPNQTDYIQILDFQISSLTDIRLREWTGWGERRFQRESSAIHISLYDGLPSDVGIGYAHFPWISLDESGGIYLENSAFKKDQSISGLIHLIANHLGLYALTGEYPCGDDYVKDTPIHNSPMPLCSDLEIISTCDNQIFSITNFMSHAPEECRDHFTLGQWRRMIHIMNYYTSINKN